MKKLLVVACCFGALVLAGCSSDETPEAFGKKYIEKKFENINCNLLDLDYSVKEEGENAAIVLVEGTIKYKDEIYLVKKGNEWVVDEKTVKKTDAEEADAKIAAKADDAAKPLQKADLAKKVTVDKNDTHAQPVKKEAHVQKEAHVKKELHVEKEAHVQKAAPSHH